MENKNKTSIKKCIVDLIEDSTMHGLPRIFKSKSWLVKIMWFLCFLGSTGYCVYLTLTSVFDFLDYNVVTSIETFREIPSTLPAITICNLNQYQNNNSFEFVENRSKLYKSFGFQNFEIDFFILNEIITLNETLKRSFSYSLDEALIKCTINNIECDSSQFKWIFHPALGNCFQFNTGKYSNGSENKLNIINRPGLNNGLRLELFIGNPDIIFDFIQKTGYHVIVSNQTAKLGIDEGFDVSTGTETSISINRLFTKQLPLPFNDCSSNLDHLKAMDIYLYKALTSSNNTYRQTDCFDLCYQKEVIQRCGCYLTSLDKMNGMQPCLQPLDVICSLNVWNEFLAKNFKKLYSPFCPVECESMTFQVTATFSDYPTKNYAETYLMNNSKITSKFLNNSLNYEMIKRSVLSLNVYFEQLSYTEIGQNAKTELVDLVSNIGGLLGLFIVY